jgi:hypothetical protein
MTTHAFTRQKIERNTMADLTDADLDSIPAYKAAAEIPVASKKHTAREVVVIARRTLGDDLLQRLLSLGHDEVLGVASEIIDDHLHSPDHLQNKDLQVNLVANVIKEISTEADVPTAKRCGYADELIAQLPLEQEFRGAIKKSLYDTGAIYRPWLQITRFVD